MGTAEYDVFTGSDGPLRVAAYCRVSTDKEDQRNSLSAQQAFFQRYIQAHPNWVLVDVFADEGLSGTSTRHRPQFTEMIRQAMSGAIDLILTKEVSRFARNTVDTLQITRRLKERHVGRMLSQRQYRYPGQRRGIPPRHHGQRRPGGEPQDL